MDNLAFWQTLLFFAILFFFAGYTILDGFDLGSGILAPFLPAAERDQLYQIISPFWDGNEVWGIIGGGFLFAAFPAVYATVTSGFYPAFMLLFAALILRAASFEFRHRNTKRARLWEWVFATASLGISLGFGLALGVVVAGIPLTDGKAFTGNIFALLSPYSVLFMLTGAAAILYQTTAFVQLKAEGSLKDRANRLAFVLRIVFLGLFFVLFGFTKVAGDAPLRWLFIVSIIGVILSLSSAFFIRREKVRFILSSAAFAFLWLMIAGARFPSLITDTGGLSMTVYNASSSLGTMRLLGFASVAGAILLPVLTAIIYKVFKGKVKPGERFY